MITRILAVSIGWALLSLLFCAIGALVRRAFRARAENEADVFFDWWVGCSATIVFVLAWHLALPVTPLAFVPLAFAAAAGAHLTRSDWKRAAENEQANRTALTALLVLSWLTVAALALGPDRHYDTGLYHLQSVRWAQAYAVVPGLANVHGRLGTNSSLFLFSALVDSLTIRGDMLRLAAGILLLPLVLQGVITAHAAVTGRRHLDVLRWFQTLMIPVALWKARQFAPSISPDGVVFALCVVISGELLRISSDRKDSKGEGESGASRNYHVFGIVLLAAIVVTVKLSSAVFAFAAAGVAVWQWTKVPSAADGPVPQRRARVWMRSLPLLATALVVALLWTTHGVVLSGYPAYPSTLGSFPVDWRVPPEVLVSDADWIVSWARSPGMPAHDVLGNYQWVPRWLAAAARDRDVIGATLFLAVAGVIRLLRTRTGRQPRNPPAGVGLAFLLPSLISIPAWLVTAPAIRFTIGPLWVIAAGTLAVSLAGSGYARLDNYAFRVMLPGFLTVVLVAGCVAAFNESQRPASPETVRRMKTLSGLTVFVPATGDRCGDAPLPCSSLPPNEQLELRRPGSLADGFRIAR